MAGFSDDDIRAVREKISIVDVIGDRVRLKKSGRTYKGLCPFHNEKTPSFHVDPAKQLYHCFGCGVGGDAYSFLQSAEGLDFAESVETLARRVGHTLTESNSRQPGRKTRLLQACEAATIFYQKALRSERGTGARDYIKSRGLAELAVEYKLGYSPDWSSLVDYLRQANVREEEMQAAGLTARSGKGTLYDRLRGRVIFPILDNQGRPIAFGGRVLDDSTPKYLNSPETPIYHKGAVLYGLSQAKNDFLRTESALVVEGYTDLLALAGAGVKNVVATLGTAFTEDHLRLLGRFVNRVMLVFDGDEAGLKAAERTSEYLNLQRLPGREVLDGLIDNVETELLVAVLPAALDPADYIAKYGAVSFSSLISEARPLGLFLLDRVVERSGTGETAKLKAAAQAAPLIAGLSSAVAKEEYMRYLGEKLNVSFEAMTAVITQAGRSGRRRAAPQPPLMPKRATGPERELVKAVLKEPGRVGALGDMDLEAWPDERLARLAQAMIDSVSEKGDEIGDMIHQLDSALSKLLSELSLEPIGGVDLETHFMEVYLKCKETDLDRHIECQKKALEQTDSTDKRYDELFEELVAMEYKRRELRNNIIDGGTLWVRK